jgi:FdrA protein
VAVISVPGAYAAAEAHLALSQGLNVFLFSDNVALADEVELKRRADGRGLLIMGPDCGTSILNGIGFGFANRVRRGSIGIVGASGTGIQEVASLIHQWGGGVSHAIGTGGRDMCTAVGGTTTRHAIALLCDDPATQTLVVLSKSSDEDVERGVLALLASSGKRAIACVLDSRTQLKAVERASSLEEAARLALGKARSEDVLPAPELRLADGQRQIRGLFCGGTLCHEATVAVGDWADHRFVDFGEDQYTRGRAHPMIDPTLRNHAIVQAGRDPNVAVILLDVVLGLAAHPDPAGAAAPAIGEARAAAEGVGRDLAVIAHVVGTDEDPQVIARQEAKLRAAGVRVAPSNFAAATLAARLVARAGA